MALNIKNPRVCDLARQAAEVTGLSQTSAIEAALEALLREHTAAARVSARHRRADAILDQIHATLDTQAPGLGELLADLYDEQTGLPR